MKLLTSKSILDCNVLDDELHGDEINEIFDIIFSLKDYDCIAVIKKDQAEENKAIKLHDIMELLECFDFKNGIDIGIGDNNILCFKIYGQVHNDNLNVVIIHLIAIEQGEPIDLSMLIKSKIISNTSIIN